MGMIIAAPLLRWLLHTPDYPETFTFYCRMDALAYGSMVARLIRNFDGLRRSMPSFDKILQRVGMVIIPATLMFWLVTRGDRSKTIVSTLGLVMADFSFALITCALVRNAGGNQSYIKIFRSLWLCSIGTVSYSLYLFHYDKRGRFED